MGEVSLFRLYLMRGLYLLIAVGLGSEQWPILIERAHDAPLMTGVAHSLFAALSALCLLGLRYPLQMLPLLLFELAWKVIWLVAIALRLYLEQRLPENFMPTVWACLLVVIVPIVLPWRYIITNYAAKPGDRWW
ncbi:MAG: hypothetical protein U1E87_03170 [Alphaproteobacteria bacterium]